MGADSERRVVVCGVWTRGPGGGQVLTGAAAKRGQWLVDYGLPTKR